MGKETKFTIKAVWLDMCSSDPKVGWHSVIWFNKCIPRHAFVLWMAVQKRLSTQDRVAVWILENGRMFKKDKRDEKTVLQIIKETVRLKMASFKVKNSMALREVESRWDMSFKKVV
ncbi:reverse transcriptase domain-containing protein [Tanacetum coccineum]